jgi:hypothetical protein
MRQMRAAVRGGDLRTVAELCVFPHTLFPVPSCLFSVPYPLSPITCTLLLVTRHTSLVTSARQEAA